MKKLTRALLYFLGAIFILLAAFFLAVNLYVQSKGTQARIQDELSRRLGTTLRIQRISVTPWWGLKLTGITIPQADGTVGHDFLQATTFRLRVRLASLFARELLIKEISLVDPTVYWAQNESGKWRIPATLAAAEEPPAAGAAAAEESAAADVPPPAPASETPAAGFVSPFPPARALGGTPSPFTPEVRRVNLTNGNFHFLDPRGRLVAKFSGVNFRSNFRRTTELRGNARVNAVALRDRFFLKDLRSPIAYGPDMLEFSRIQAQAGGGEISGQFVMHPADPGSPFEAKIDFKDVQADRIVSEAGGPSGMVQGRIEGHLQAQGKTSDANALAGIGEIYLREGQLRQYSLLVALGQLLQISELAQLRFEEAHVKYHITPGVVMIDELMLQSANLRVAAQGTVDFDGRVQLDSKLAIDDRIRGRLFRGMRESFTPTGEPGFAALDFKITGTLQKPKTDLVGKLVGRDLRDLSGIISTFFGGGKEKKAKEAARAESAVAPADEAEPSPSATP